MCCDFLSAGAAAAEQAQLASAGDHEAKTEAMVEKTLDGVSPRRAAAVPGARAPDGGAVSYSAAGVPLGPDGLPVDGWVGHSAPMWPESVLWGHNSPVTCLVVSAALDVVISGSHSNTLLMHSLTEGGGGKLLREFALAAPPRMGPVKKKKKKKKNDNGGGDAGTAASAGAGAGGGDAAAAAAASKSTDGEIESEYLMSCAVRKLALAKDGTVIAYSVSNDSGSGLLQASRSSRRCTFLLRNGLACCWWSVLVCCPCALFH